MSSSFAHITFDGPVYRVSSRESVVSRDAEMLKISIGVNGRPASRSIRVASADMIPRSVRLFHCDCTRKQNVVLQVNVLVKIGFKVRQRLVEGLITDAGDRKSTRL